MFPPSPLKAPKPTLSAYQICPQIWVLIHWPGDFRNVWKAPHNPGFVILQHGVRETILGYLVSSLENYELRYDLLKLDTGFTTWIINLQGSSQREYTETYFS